MAPTIIILAAGIGSRYGSLKQMDEVGPSGETIMDYSLFDALRAGFGRAVFVIRRSIEAEFKETILGRLKGKVEAGYVFQELEDVPPGFQIPAERKKPWGTSHAVLAAAAAVDTPFAVINADDFYGRRAFEIMAGFLSGLGNDDDRYALVGYLVENTLSEHGSVARGVCDVAADGWLRGIVERTHVEKGKDGGAVYQDAAGRLVAVPAGTAVSMNFWGFAPNFFGYARAAFGRFLAARGLEPKAELYIPDVVSELIQAGRARVTVLPTPESWFGVTYREDKPRVSAELERLVAAGEYPAYLWD
jgi:dTDP-glucose pyrophosphorylase